MKFLYQTYHTVASPTVPSGMLHRPEVPLRVIGASGAGLLSVLVDCGSDDTLIPLSVGKNIGAALDATQTWIVEGLGGHSMPVILAEVILELTDGLQTFRWPAKVGLVDFADPQDEVTLLGHAGCLDFFRVTFDGHLQTLEVEVTPAFPGQVF
jgi:hypothetical protein